MLSIGVIWPQHPGATLQPAFWKWQNKGSACHRLPCCALCAVTFCAVATRWMRVVMPIPNAALTKFTRFRWKQTTHSQPSSWAIDNGKSRIKNIFDVIFRIHKGSSQCSDLSCHLPKLLKSWSMNGHPVDVTRHKDRLCTICGSDVKTLEIITDCVLFAVFLGVCPQGCNGHGFCTDKGCVCSIGYEGSTCARSSGSLPAMLIDPMGSIESIKTNFALTRGASLSYTCGVVGSGKAVVFHRDGPRQIQTVDLNTTYIRYLRADSNLLWCLCIIVCLFVIDCVRPKLLNVMYYCVSVCN